MDQFEVVFYGSGIKDAPQKIIDKDNNKKLLGACTLPKTEEQLHDMRIEFNDKQLELLQKWRLLNINNQIFQTAFPILSKNQLNELRKFTRSIAPQILQNVKPELNNFLQLIEKDYPDNAYILFFSYIIDGLIWDCFTDRGLAPDLLLKDKDNLWVGVLWGVSEPRPFFLGTNGYVFDDIYYRIAWNNDLLPKLKPLFLHPDKIPAAVEKLKVPSIYELPGDPVYENSLNLSSKLADEVLNLLNLPDLMKKYDLSDEKQTLVIIYHELMWDILEEVESMGLLSKPAIVSNPEEARDSDIADLIFLVKSNH